MKTVELYARVRRAVFVEGISRRAAAREFGLARKTVSKMLTYSAPPGYQRQKPVNRPKLGPWQGAIDAILEDDKQRRAGNATRPAQSKRLRLLDTKGQYFFSADNTESQRRFEQSLHCLCARKRGIPLKRVALCFVSKVAYRLQGHSQRLWNSGFGNRGIKPV